jgi:L,D-peptidoglycan transpeptidase YkuD (ErfK/YbiS/YcfS/YnhG family)
MISRVPRAALLAASLMLTGCGGGAVAASEHVPGTTTVGTSTPTPAPTTSLRAAPQEIPGLGPRHRAAIPSRTGQVVVVTGRGRNSPDATVVLYQRKGADWQAGAAWPAHNALRGWSDHHMSGDLRSPIGVYTLSDAGGLNADPGSRLPYHRSAGFSSPGTGFEGEPLDGAFDYVIAIDYNRRPGTSPLDWTRPLGASRGGGIWLHVDHGGPTHGCVSVSEEHMKELLLALDPARHPVVVMGDAASLSL